MSLLLYSQIPGTQVKRDVDLSNATIQCDPKLLFPRGASQGGVPLNKENLAGKIAVEHDICNLDVNNLTVNGVLAANGPSEICNIVCPEDFNLTVGSAAVAPLGLGNVNINAHNNINLLADGPGVGDIVLSTVGSTDGDITATADGDVFLTSTNLMRILSTTDNIVVDAGGLTSINSGTSNVIVNAGSNQTVAGSNNLFVAAGTSILMTADTGDVEINAPNGTATFAGGNADQTIIAPATGRLGFYGGASSAPQQAAPAAAAVQGAAYVQADVQSIATAVNALIVDLQNLGLIA